MNLKGVVLTAAAVLLLAAGCDSRSGFGASNVAVPVVPVVKMVSYERVKPGMTYATAVEVIGFRGEEISRSHMAGVPGVMGSIETVMYQWVNPDGSNMNAMFQNDSLIQKAQFGLR